MRILIAEDEISLARALIRIFEKNNYSADAVHNGEDIIPYLEANSYDALILDIMMPRLDGLTVLKRIRARGNSIPVLILTARSDVEDKCRGLDYGANYYLTKPFDTKELLATLRAITRGENVQNSKLVYGNTTLDRASFELSTADGCIRLAKKEFQMMEYLMLHPDTLTSSDRFMEKIWGYACDAEVNVVWVYISYIRKKLAALNSNIIIKASRNAGYCLAIEE